MEYKIIPQLKIEPEHIDLFLDLDTKLCLDETRDGLELYFEEYDNTENLLKDIKLLNDLENEIKNIEKNHKDWLPWQVRELVKENFYGFKKMGVAV